MFTIDFTKPWLYKDIIYFNQGNLSTNNTLRCKLVTGGSDDFTGGSIACTFTTKDSIEISGFGRLIDAKGGIIDIVFPSNALVVGTNKLEVLVNRADGGVAQSPPILYDIWQGLTTGNGIEAETNYPILIELINSTNEASNKANLALNKANSMITDITDAIDNAYRSANEADIATSSANAKIEEVETAKTEMIKKVDTSIVTMKSEVETAKNEMVSKADEKMQQVDRALAAGTVDLELKQAREDASGVVYDNLKQMLDANLGVEGKTLKDLVIDMNNMKEMQDLEYSTDKGYAVCEKTGNGTVKDLKIYGRSFVNITQFKDKTLTLTEGKYYNDILICPVNRISVNKDYLFSYDIEIISNTTTTILGTNSSCQFGVGVSDFKTHPTMQVDGKTGFTVSSSSRNSFKINVSDFKGEENFRLRPLYPSQAPIPTGQSITYRIKNMMLIEYTQNPPNGYIEGIASVGNGNEIEVLSRKEDGNLFDISLMKNPSTTISIVDRVITTTNSYFNNSRITMKDLNFIPNEQYSAYCNIALKNGTETGANGSVAFVKDSSVKYLIHKGVPSTNFIAPADLENWVLAFYGRGDGIVTFTDLCITKSINTNGYIEPKQDKKTILFKDTDNSWKPITNLRGIDENNCDIVDSVNNKLDVKYIDKIVDGTENITIMKTKGTNTLFKVELNVALKPNAKILCDKYKTISYYDNFNSDVVGVSSYDLQSRTYIAISDISSTVEDFKNKLKINNLNLILEVNNPKSYEINPIFPSSYENETMISFGSGAIATHASWKITSSLPNFVKELSNQIKQLQEQVYKTNVANFAVALNTLDTKLRLDRLEAPQM
ncbi:hypothetical protein C671_1218 [[Clostridium] bifermentans ATCC 19299]|uniref:hypothetical protein n=1 Tax=Paraclostridium bifermentans TaxID=1490 RepID=UPI00038C8770|nr:hypothetical protein [Paraclostridium bifermentans]EQK47138.1 hypothetical protein C671_1218 [[Clostridium] bifermentans ATCC 19299] [Paraclostridium bifermentans ATCC 19299]